MKGMRRYLVLFARAPEREAREKGFAGREAAELFAAFADGWREAARLAGARLVVATPPEDRAAWRGGFSADGETIWFTQRGRSFGERLEQTARRVAALGGQAIIVGGDVAPSSESLAAAFDSLERGTDAVLAPAEDGGVSLIGLRQEDLDLLGAISLRRREVFAALSRSLAQRGRSLGLVPLVRDVDRPRDLRSLLRARTWHGAEQVHLRCLARRALAIRFEISVRPAEPLSPGLISPSGLRAPPLAA